MLMLTKTIGDVRFYQNEEGEVFQQILNQEPQSLAIEEDTYCEVQSDESYIIRYDLSGVNGFSIWSKDETFHEDSIWSLKEAEDYILRHLPRACTHCQTSVYFEQSPEWELCSRCESIVCNDCVDWTLSNPEGHGIICASCAN